MPQAVVFGEVFHPRGGVGPLVYETLQRLLIWHRSASESCFQSCTTALQFLLLGDPPLQLAFWGSMASWAINEQPQYGLW
jgi:hypothetical protein